MAKVNAFDFVMAFSFAQTPISETHSARRLRLPVLQLVRSSSQNRQLQRLNCHLASPRTFPII
jgi:hypothetical protein